MISLEAAPAHAPPSLPMTVIEDAVGDPRGLARTLRSHLGPHPVPQSDPRTRGMMMEIEGAEDLARLRVRFPALAALVDRFAGDPDAVYVVAVNDTPPSPPDAFFMRPHVDRRWMPGGGFAGAAPRWTNVVFLDFPEDGDGGELVVFPPGAFPPGRAVPREDARRTLRAAGGVTVQPRPGHACRMAGHLPHAVLGYAAREESPWRLAVVVAEFGPAA
jgi:hypothetical protein